MNIKCVTAAMSLPGGLALALSVTLCWGSIEGRNHYNASSPGLSKFVVVSRIAGQKASRLELPTGYLWTVCVCVCVFGTSGFNSSKRALKDMILAIKRSNRRNI